jgi:sn-glycerol 3-phosphate transport system substrate-binding protein
MLLTRIVLGVGLAGLIAAGSPAEAETKIDFFFPVPVEGKLAQEMTRMVKVYNAAQPDVQVTAVYTGSYDETKLKAQAAAKAGKPPAVVLMSANFILDLTIDNSIASLEPMLKAWNTTREQYLADYWPALRGNAVVNGELYAVPFQNSTPLLYYNADQFKEAGLDPQRPPRNWTELLAYAKKLTRRNGDQVERYGLMMPSGYDYLGWLVSTFAMANGGQYYNPDFGGEVYYDDPSTLGAVRFWDDLVHKSKVMPTGVNEAGTVSTAFFAGQAAMVVLSTGSLSFIRDNAKFKYDVAFVPGQLRYAVPIGGGSLVVFRGLTPEQEKAAWAFVAWMTAPEQLGSWSRFTGYFAPRKSSYDLADMRAFLEKNPDATVALHQLDYAHSWFSTYQTVPVRKAIEDEVQAVLSGKKSAEQAVKDAQRKADEIMRPYVEASALKATD